MAGGAAQFLMQVPSLYHVGFRFAPILSFRDPGVKQVFRLMTPAILGTSAVQINVLVNTSFVSDISGAQSWLNCAFRLMQLPIGIFGVAVATAAIPALSKFAAQKDTQKFRETLGSSIRLVFLMTLPSACGLIVLGEPIIRLLYERGKFDALATNMTAWALAAYAIGLTGYAAIKIISPAFYALDDARTPMIISLASIVVNAVAGYVFRILLSDVGVTEQTPGGFGHVGVALATSTIALVNFLALLILLRRKIKRIEGGKILLSLVKIGIASAILSAVCYFSYLLLLNFFGAGNLLFRTIEVFVPIALGGGTFLIIAKLLGVTELNQAYNAFARKLGRQRA
jgi:putative peptidoglycan lipid II flippase